MFKERNRGVLETNKMCIPLHFYNNRSKTVGGDRFLPIFQCFRNLVTLQSHVTDKI